MNELLTYGLNKLEMLKDDESTGLVKVDVFSNLDVNSLQPEEIIAIDNAIKYNVDFIYFRRFPNRPSIPQVYIYDFTGDTPPENDLIELHRKLYSSGHVPMFFVFTKSDIRIFNCYERPAEQKQLAYKPLTTIKLAAEVIDALDRKERKENEEKFHAFSGKSFDNGSFWENSHFSNSFKFSNSAYEQLLSELKQALKDIIDQGILSQTIARKLLVMSILIKYLEERKDENGNSVFPKAGEERLYTSNGKRSKKKFDKDFFDQFAPGAKNFIDVLKEKGAYLRLFDHLAKHFNGGIFQLNDEERTELENTDLTRFALFFEGKMTGIQYVFWRLYSFDDLPVELISNIYEEFLEKKPGVVYTPPFLVNFLLDEVMPLSDTKTDFKVLDPACGSGVFLVGAFRRLIYRWRKKNQWKNPSLEVLKSLLRENIYGVDKDFDAIHLSAFSLSLVLCDELTPLQIWEELQFDNLYENNLKDQDFFELVFQNKFQIEFDLIIGNPPFEEKLTEAAHKVERQKRKDRNISFVLDNKKTNIALPGNQISLLFLEQSIPLTKKGGLTCLIQPSGPLLYNNSSANFRRHLLEKYFVPQIIDFTHISRILFTNGKGSERRGDVATAAIFIRNEPPKEKGILHIIPKRTKPHKEKIYFELDTYDFHYIPRDLALKDVKIWKCNLFGGSRVHQLIIDLDQFEKLENYLIEKRKESNWDYGEGFMRGGPDTKRANFITGKKGVLAPNFTSNKIKPDTVEIDFFTSPRRKSLFKGPLLLIKEIIDAETSKIPIAYFEEDIVFDSRIVGIAANSSKKGDLQYIHKTLVQFNELLAFYIIATSSQYSVNLSSAIRADDLYNLPLLPKGFELSKIESILIADLVEFFLPFRRQGEKSLVATANVSEKQLKQFSDVFCDIVNSVYKILNAHKPFETSSFICFPFYFGEKPTIQFDPQNAESDITKLVQKHSGTSLRLTRVIRIYEDNIIYLIKPKKLRYWLRSIALRDADETFADLRKQGY